MSTHIIQIQEDSYPKISRSICFLELELLEEISRDSKMSSNQPW